MVGTACTEAVHESLGDDGSATEATVDAVLNLTRELAAGVAAAEKGGAF